MNTEVEWGHLGVIQHCPKWRVKGSGQPSEDLVLLEVSRCDRKDAKLSPGKAAALIWEQT